MQVAWCNWNTHLLAHVFRIFLYDCVLSWAVYFYSYRLIPILLFTYNRIDFLHYITYSHICNVSKVDIWSRSISAIRQALFSINITFLDPSSCDSARIVHFLYYTRIHTSYHLLTSWYCIICISTHSQLSASFGVKLVPPVEWLLFYGPLRHTLSSLLHVLFRISLVLPSSQSQTVQLISGCCSGDPSRLAGLLVTSS